MTGIIAIDRHAGPFLDQPTHVVHIDADRVQHDLSALHTSLSEQLEAQGPLLVMLPARLDPGLRHALHLVRTALGSPPILWHTTALPPLAADVLVTLAGALSVPLGGSACVAAILPVLERQLVTYTWVPSVTRVEDPAPTLRQHAQSSLPGTSWLISTWPDPAIRRLGTEPPPVPRPSQQIGMAVATLDGDTGWVQPVVAAHLPDAAVVQVDPPSDLATWWGCRQATQVVLYPRCIPTLVTVLRSRLDAGRCRWCHRDVGSLMCPWCALPRTGVIRIGPDGDGASHEDVFDMSEGMGSR